MKDLLKRIGRWSVGSEGRPGPRQVVSQRDIDRERLMDLGRKCAILITDDPQGVIFTRTPSEALNAVEGVMALARAWKHEHPSEKQGLPREFLDALSKP